MKQIKKLITNLVINIRPNFLKSSFSAPRGDFVISIKKQISCNSIANIHYTGGAEPSIHNYRTRRIRYGADGGSDRVAATCIRSDLEKKHDTSFQ
jgi:hypothetical protein